MALLWLILEILVLFFYTNLSEFNEAKLGNQTSSIRTNYGSIQTVQSADKDNLSELNYGDEELIDEENDNLIKSANVILAINNDEIQTENPKPSSSSTSLNKKSYESIRIVDNSETTHFLVRLYEEYVKEEVITVYACSFLVFFMQTTLETMLTPFTKDYFGWSDIENSILYGVCGVEIMLVFLLIGYFSKRVRDRTLLTVGLLCNLVTLIFLIVYVPMMVPLNKSVVNYVLFFTPVVTNVFSLPLIVISSITLLSKVTKMENQGLTQGIRRAVVGIACILGPNWSGN